MFVILPFEKKYYENLNYEVNYVGHPLLDVLKNKGKLNEKREKIIALLPGSRDQEISKILPLMLSVAGEFKDYKFVICAAPSKTIIYYKGYIKKINCDNVEIVENQTYNILQNSCAALVTSGTATLETALFKTPQVVCYKSSWISFQIGKILLKNLKFISLVNLILDKPAVTELIQGELNKQNIIKELKNILSEGGRKKVLDFYKDLEKLLSKEGASKETAFKIVNYHLEPNS
jgi:lipid-A-disaccharide synthase